MLQEVHRATIDAVRAGLAAEPGPSKPVPAPWFEDAKLLAVCSVACLLEAKNPDAPRRSVHTRGAGTVLPPSRVSSS